jgi:hypothetical protein
LKEFSFGIPPEQKGKFLIKNLFRSATKIPSLQILELMDHDGSSPCISLEGLETFFPNLKILKSHRPMDKFESDEEVLNSFLYVVRKFPKLEEIQFNHKTRDYLGFTIENCFNTRIPRLLKKEKPSLVIYYAGSCRYEPEPAKEVTTNNNNMPVHKTKQKREASDDFVLEESDEVDFQLSEE